MRIRALRLWRRSDFAPASTTSAALQKPRPVEARWRAVIAKFMKSSRGDTLQIHPRDLKGDLFSEHAGDAALHSAASRIEVMLLNRFSCVSVKRSGS